jgi:2-alkyl-3-oxoalkanoate reductase
MGASTVLVTGATGFLGGRLTESLVRQGFRVRALVRQRSKAARLESIGIEICVGDVQDIHTLKTAMETADIVIHAAADTSGDARGGELTTVMGTRNMIEAALNVGIKQFIYLSSCSVYGIADCRPGQQVDESGPLERHPEARGHYSNAKFKAEQIVVGAMNNGHMNITCLRPGTIWGPGGETFTPMMGIKAGSKLFGMIGRWDFVLPIVYLDNLVSAVIKCINHPGAYNKIFNVVDPQQVDKKTYTRAVLKPLFPGGFFFRIPYWALYATVGFQEMLCKILRRGPYLTRYRLLSSQRPVVYSGKKIEAELDWFAPVSFDEAVREVLQFKKTT